MYVKVFERMLSSSIMDEEVNTRWIWVALLLMADRDGYVYGTPTALARRANVPLDIFSASFARLMEPDPNSSSDDEEGRRVVGEAPRWRIVNYAYYRDLKDEDARRAADAERQRQHRAKVLESRAVTRSHAQSRAVTRSHAPSRAVTLSDADTDADAATAADWQTSTGTAQAKSQITLDRATWRFLGITDAHRERWRRAAPLVDLDADLAAAAAWCAANPDRAPRVRVERFLLGWFRRSQERQAREAAEARPSTRRPQRRPADAVLPNPEPPPPRQTLPVDLASTQQAAAEVWQAALPILEARLDGDYATWIAPLRPLGLQRDTLYLAAPDSVHATWVRDNTRDEIKEALVDAGHELRVDVSAEEAA